MSIWAVIPAKDPRRAKSRLAQVLSPEERHALSLRLLIHTLRVATSTPAIARCLVVSESEELLTLAAQHGAHGISEPAPPDALATGSAPSRTSSNPPDARLNAALAHATNVAIEGGATAVLVLAADLPLLTPRDLRQLPKWMPPRGGVVLIPDRRLTGTNALLVQPPSPALFTFGPDSLARHKRRARALGLPAVVWSTPALRMDLDTPEDLEEARAQAGSDSPVAGVYPHDREAGRLGDAPSQRSHAGRAAGSTGERCANPAEMGRQPIDFAAAAQRLRQRKAASDRQ